MEVEVPLLEVSIDIERENAEVPLKTMVTSLREGLNKLSRLTPNHCIYRVPKQLYVKNPAAYTPQVVAIGPIHHKREGLEAMEEYKQRYMLLFLKRVKISLEDYADFVKHKEGRLRECYADTINYTSNEFVKIMMIDSAFVYEMLVRTPHGVDDSCGIFNRPYLLMNVMEDLMLLENQIPLFILEDLFNLDKEAAFTQQPISSIGSDDLEDLEDSKGEGQTKPGMSSILNLEDASKELEEIKSNTSSDLANQGKLQCCANVLRPIIKWAKPHITKPAEDISISPPPDAGLNSFMALVCKFINLRPDIGASKFDFNKVCSSKVVHLLDCLWRCHLSPRQLVYPAPLEDKTTCCISTPCFPIPPPSSGHISAPDESFFLVSEPESRKIFHQLPEKVGYLVLGCLRRCQRGEAHKKFNLGVSAPTATELHQSGVRFTQNTNSTHLLDIKFNRQLGILKIPHFFMGDSTETIFRNLLAFEQCHYIGNAMFTDYFYFLDQLISEPSDVDLLVQGGVLENALGDNMRAANIMNNIGQGLGVTSQPYFQGLCRLLVKYYKVPWHKWKATLRQDYFNSPWAGISVTAAVILLALTVVQTVYAIISK